MHRLTTIIAMIALLAVPASAVASPEQIYADCEDNGRLDRPYGDGDLREALRDIPPDLDEYSNCSELIRGQLAGVNPGSGRGAAGTGGTTPQGLPEGNGVGSVPLGPNGKPLDPLLDAADEEKRDVASASAGEDIKPTSAGVRPGEPDGELPGVLIALLVLGGVALAASAAHALKGRVLGRPA